jgi:hypothetical protein
MMPENNTYTSIQTTFSQAQIEYLSSLHFINKVDHHLKLLSSVKVINPAENTPPRVILELEIFYDNHQTGTLSFDLHNYGYEDIIGIAQNVRSNEFILQEVDNFLSGDVVE